MDLLLVNPYPLEAAGINEGTVEVPLGLLSIAAVVREAGFTCGLVDANAEHLTTEDVARLVRAARPVIAGISINSFSYRRGLAYARAVKAIDPSIIVLFGGPHATVRPAACLAASPADAVVIGEGETTVREILENRRNSRPLFDGVDGVAWRGGSDEVKINGPRARIRDLDALPFPAYDLLPSLGYYRSRARRRPFMGLITSRGCPSACTFCSKAVFQSQVVLRSPENIIKEVDLLVEKYGIRQLDILDDNFTVRPDRVEKFCNLLLARPYRLAINLQSGIRVDTVTPELLALMKRAGVFKVAFGVESGVPEIIRNIRKKIDLDQVLRAGRWARQAGLVTYGFFMIGLPGDTEATMQRTIDFAREMNPHYANFCMTIPFYGTPLYEQVKQEGRLLIDTIDGLDVGFYSQQVFYEIGGLKAETVLRYYKKAYKEFYGRPGKILDILSTVKSWGELQWLAETAMSTVFARHSGESKTVVS